MLDSVERTQNLNDFHQFPTRESLPPFCCLSEVFVSQGSLAVRVFPSSWTLRHFNRYSGCKAGSVIGRSPAAAAAATAATAEEVAFVYVPSHAAAWPGVTLP